MGELALTVALGRIAAGSDQYVDRMARLRAEVQAAMTELEAVVRDQAPSLGVPQADVGAHVRRTVGRAVLRAVESVVEDGTGPRRLSGWPVDSATPDTPRH